MENYEDRLNQLKKNSKYHIENYKDALKLFDDYFKDSDEEGAKIAVETLEQCIDSLEERIIDAHVLNELRLITDTSGDLDLKARVKELVEKEKELKDCKNELCLKCGAYRDGGLIVCENCRWYK